MKKKKILSFIMSQTKLLIFENCLSNFNNKQNKMNFEDINYLDYNPISGIIDIEENNYINSNMTLPNLDSLSLSFLQSNNN